jgi:hypothetical protein
VAVEDLLTRPGFLLLVRTSDAVDELRETLGDLGTVIHVVRDGASGDDVVDADDVLARAYGWGHEGFALVRPDGYLGLVSDSADVGVLRDYRAGTLRVTQPSRV